MTNLDLATGILEKHRQARNWTDLAVAVDLLAQFGLDPAGTVGAVVVEAPAAQPAAVAAPTAPAAQPAAAEATAVGNATAAPHYQPTPLPPREGGPPPSRAAFVREHPVEPAGPHEPPAAA